LCGVTAGGERAVKILNALGGGFCGELVVESCLALKGSESKQELVTAVQGKVAFHLITTGGELHGG